MYMLNYRVLFEVLTSFRIMTPTEGEENDI